MVRGRPAGYSRGLTLGCQLLPSYHYDGGENAHPGCRRSRWDFKMLDCYWLPGLKPLAIKTRRTYIAFIEPTNL